jgi:hypothetical protein
VGQESASSIPEIRLVATTPNIGSQDQGRIIPSVSQSTLHPQIDNAAGIQRALFDGASSGNKTGLGLRAEQVLQSPDVAVQCFPDNDLAQPRQTRRQDLPAPLPVPGDEQAQSGATDVEETPEESLAAQFMALRNRFTKQTGAGSRPSAAEPASMQPSTNATPNTASSTLSASQPHSALRLFSALFDPDPVDDSPSVTRHVDAFTPSQPSSNAESFIRKSSAFVGHVSPNEGLQQPRSVASPVLLADPDDDTGDFDILQLGRNLFRQ